MNTFLPPQLESRFTKRAKNAICATFKKSGTGSILLLYGLVCEKGSLAKNILSAHNLTSRDVAKLIGPAKSNNNRRKKNFLNKELREIIKRAAKTAANQRQPYIGTEHLLYATLLQKNALSLLHGIWHNETDKNVNKIKKHLDTIFSQSIHLPSFPHIFKKQDYLAYLDSTKASDELSETTKRGVKKITKAPSKPPRFHKKNQEKLKSHKHSQTPALEAFCENLTELAQSRSLDPLIGREKDIARIIHILSRRTKNNPLLIGEPGVGKTAIVQGLAQKINNGEVPSSLLHKSIFSLSLSSLIAGTMFRGDFEARIRDILNEASREGVILFIDEMHTIIGAGAAQGSLDTANILKPALSNGTVQCIGATTLDEYRKYIEKDRALERRLQTVTIEEETEEQSIITLSNLKRLYEKHHDITIEDEAIEAAVRLSARYIQDRFLPDKALDVLDEASSKLKNNSTIIERTKKIRKLEKRKLSFEKKKEEAIFEENYQDAIVLKHREGLAEEELKYFRKKFPLYVFKPRLTKFDIEETIVDLTGIPIQKSAEDGQLKKLSASLSREVIGQKEAVARLIFTLKRNKAGLTSAARPVGSFLFLGPCGVGKTALARTLAEKNSQAFIKLNMSEYSEPYTISRLIGSPPGYIGYGESGELTEKIRRNPHGVVLFDEIEKAHPQIHSLLLQILEDGTLQDSSGRSVTFKNATIILTSNMGLADSAHANTLGFSESSQETIKHNREEKYLDEIKETLRPEILSRIDRVIVFNNLGKREIFEITKLHLGKLSEQLAPLNLEVSKAATRHVAQSACKSGEGARHVRSTIEQLVEEPLAEFLIGRNNVKTVKIDISEGKITVA